MKSNPSLNIRLIDWHECDERDVEEVEYTDKSGNMKIRKNTSLCLKMHVLGRIYMTWNRRNFLVD